MLLGVFDKIKIYVFNHKLFAKRRAAAALVGSRPVALAPPARLRHRPRGEGTGATKSQDDGETTDVGGRVALDA
jgi:hypothetical protein